MTNPQDQEKNLINTYTNDKGQLPLLNNPATPLAPDFPLTGYRDQTDDRGVNNKEAAVEFLASLDTIPKNAEGKFDVFLLNEIPVPEGSAAPLEMFRRGLLEIGAEAFLHATYPEWIGDATDDANMELDAIAYVHHLKEMGYEKLNDDLNYVPSQDEDGDEEYPEDNILYYSYSMITQELNTLMIGRVESKRLNQEQRDEREREYMERHAAAMKWAKETYDLDLHWEPSEMQGYATAFYVEPDRLTGYIIWDNPFRIAIKKVRPSTDVSFWGQEGYEVWDYIAIDGGENPSTYPVPRDHVQY